MTVTITREFCAEAVRFDFDNQLIPAGWSQLDTESDASWFGLWAHPVHRKLISFCEGDITAQTCSDAESFRAEVERIATWHQQQGGRLRIDPGLKPERAQQWRDAGLGHLLHGEG